MHSFTNRLSEINSWEELFSYANSLTEKEKGDLFESLTKLILTTKPEYSSILKNVWIQREGIPKDIREKLNLPSTDEGIDLVAETFAGEYWAIQCKFKGQNQAPTYKELSTFGNLANNYCRNIALALLVHTGEKGVRKGKLLGDKYSEIGLEFWLGLTGEDWERIHKSLKGQSTRPSPKKPRPHQGKAIHSATEHYMQNYASRGRLIMPCGTGKSLAAFWIANALNAKSIVVAVPSLALIKQSLEDWTREFLAYNEEPRPEWLVICSDESTANLERDDFVSETYSLGIPTTTDVTEISSFLLRRGRGRKVVFTTYQSSDRLAQASRETNSSFDFAILDEAHKTVGVKSKTFATLLSDENIRISKRMFMTATERVLRGNNDEVYSMDDEDIYGRLFYQLSFKEAIHAEPPIISDYKILTITVTNDEIRQLIERNKLITDKDKKLEEKESQSFASAIALRKATQKYGIKHAISFHRSIKAADDFAALHRQLNEVEIDDVMLSSSHISSKKSAGERARLLTDFTQEQLALMTNARCLTEGVDVPAIDCVLFADPKQSTIDIVQAAGRALRPFTGKEYGYIMLPLIVPDNVSLEEFSESTPFKEVARIIAALSTQDEGIAEEFRIKSSGKSIGGQKIIIDGSVPVGVKLDLTSFAETVNAKIWERVGKVNWRPFEEARKFVHSLQLQSVNEWRNYCQSGKKPKDIPVSPDVIYSNKGWINYGDWLGTDAIAPQLREYLTFYKARAFVQTLNLNSQQEWGEYCRSGMKPENIPSAPERIYLGKGWKNLGDWLGTGVIATQNREYRPFKDARAFVHKLNLRSAKQWNLYCQSGNKPDDIPVLPHKTYKEKGWKGMGDWLGTGNIANFLKEYQPFVEARAFVHKLKLKNNEDWKNYSKSGNKPDNIPSSPDRTYSNRGWKSWGDWLGTNTVAPFVKKFLNFEEARTFVHSLRLKSSYEWRNYCLSGEKPEFIPTNPHRTYADIGWNGINDWLGTGRISPKMKEYRSFDEARAFVHRLKLNGIKEWALYCKTGQKPDDIPSNPNYTFKNIGWISWGDWLGTGTIASNKKVHRSFEQARAFVHGLNLGSSKEWRNYNQSGNKPDDIPAAPQRTYSRKGWKSWGDWLGTGTIAPHLIKYRSFKEAREFVHDLKLKSGSEWQRYCASGMKPKDIPNKPNETYSNEGWNGMGDWLGTGTIVDNPDHADPQIRAVKRLFLS